jgi:DNA-3-methyladenine glycosylase II
MSADRWTAGRALLREADPRMRALVDAEPDLNPDELLGGMPRDLWGALVLQVIGQQLSLAAAAAISLRLNALYDARLPTPAELLATDVDTVRGIGLSRAKAAYLHDLAARMDDGRLDIERLRRAVERIWELAVPASIAAVDAIGDRFRPWRTLAAVYLYRTL